MLICLQGMLQGSMCSQVIDLCVHQRFNTSPAPKAINRAGQPKPNGSKSMQRTTHDGGGSSEKGRHHARLQREEHSVSRRGGSGGGSGKSKSKSSGRAATGIKFPFSAPPPASSSP